MAEEEERAGPSGEARTGVKLFLGGLSWETTEDKIRRHFQQYGAIEEVIVMKDAVTKRPRGFGFITFRDPEVADIVCREQHVLDGRQIDAKHSVPQEQKPKTKKIFVGGLAPDTMEGQFRQYFEQYGKIVDAQIMQDHLSGRSRGFGFVTFEDDSAVERVFAAGTMHDLAGKRVEVKTATPRGSGPVGARGPVVPGRSPGRGPFPGRGPGFDGEHDQLPGGYGMPYAGMHGYPPGMVGYPMGYQGPYGAYGNVLAMPYGYGYPQAFPGYQVQQQGGGYEMRPGMPFPVPLGQPGQQGPRFQQQQMGPRPGQRPPR